MTPPRATVLILALCAAISCSGDATASSEGTTPAANVTVAPLLPTTVDALPTMDPDGFDRLLASVRGTPLVVNFWASWCTPCIAEAPRFVAAHARYGDRVQFLGVDIEDARDDGAAFLRTHRIPYPSVFDATSSIEHHLGLLGQPNTVFYGADGTLLATVQGEISQSDLERNLGAIAG